MGACNCIHLCNEVVVRLMLFAIHACVNGPSSSLVVPQKKGGHVGVRARQCASAVPHGNLRCGAALAHWPLLDSNCMGAHTAMCAGGSTSTTFNIITIITTYISHGGCRNVYASGGLCVFLAP